MMKHVNRMLSADGGLAGSLPRVVSVRGNIGTRVGRLEACDGAGAASTVSPHRFHARYLQPRTHPNGVFYLIRP